MTRFQGIVLLSALCLFQADALRLRSLVGNPFLPAHRRLTSGTCQTTPGVDYLDNDIKHVSNVQVSDCCTLCTQMSECNAWTWTNYASGTCWLKSAKGNTAPNAAATSAVVVPTQPGCTLVENTDYPGNDIANVGSSGAGACCSICATWPGCNAFTWTNNNGGTCWIKSKKGAMASKTGAQSAEVTNTVGQCTLQNNIDFVDNDIANTPGQSAEVCCGICNNWSGCRSFSWSNYKGGTCWLKSAKGQTVTKSGVVSSQLLGNPPPSCMLQNNVNYVDNDIGNVPATQASDCCALCRKKVGCHAFSWSNYNSGTCWLKSGRGTTAPKTGVTSAVVY